jgi:thiol:disulfide interchange protein DsbD
MVRRLVFGVLVVLGVTGQALAQDPIKWSLGKPPASVKPGQTFKIELTARIEAGWHLYSLTQGPPPIATRITVLPGQMFALDGPIDAPPPETAMDQNFGIETESYTGSAVFTLPIKVNGQASGKLTLKVLAYYQTCNDRFCLPPKSVSSEVVVQVSGPPVAGAATPATPPSAPQVAPSVPTQADGSTPAGAVGALPTAAAAATTVPEATAPPASAPVAAWTPAPAAAPAQAPGSVPAGQPASSDSLLSFILAAMAFGALSLLTPCVFPMVPITVSYFTGHSAGNRAHALRNASIYAAGIILTFTAFGMLLALVMGATSLNRFAASPWVNILITAIFVGFALNLFGLFELTLPSGLVTKLDRVTRQEGGSEVVGTLLMGLTFTLTSFTCTAPFIGTLLVAAAGGDWLWPLVGMLAFSTVFALPFFLLALVPQFVSQLPRSGAWMHAVKVLMAFLEIAAALKFISNVDLVWHWGIFTREVVLASWVVIAGAMVLYILGVFHFPGEPPIKRQRVGRWATAAACLALGVWLFTGVMGTRLGELEAFLPPADGGTVEESTEKAGIQGELTWIMNDYEGALARAKRENRRVMVDFTGYTCTNCRWMEANMFPRPDVRVELEKYVRVRMYTDGDGEIFQKQQARQQAMFKTVALPYYAVLDPNGTPVATFPGLTRDAAQFVAFLRNAAGPRATNDPRG